MKPIVVSWKFKKKDGSIVIKYWGSKMKSTRQGKCSSCFIRFVWPAKKGHELKKAFCPKCGNKLERTSFLSSFKVRFESPDFTPF